MGCRTDIGGSFRVDCSKGEMDPMTEGMVKIWGAFAEMERNIICQRVRSGMKNVAAKGKQIGRPETTKETLPDKFWKYYHMYKAGSINISELSHITDTSKIKEEIQEELIKQRQEFAECFSHFCGLAISSHPDIVKAEKYEKGFVKGAATGFAAGLLGVGGLPLGGLVMGGLWVRKKEHLKNPKN